MCVCVAAEMKENVSDRVRGAEELKSKGKRAAVKYIGENSESEPRGRKSLIRLRLRLARGASPVQQTLNISHMFTEATLTSHFYCAELALCSKEE